MSMLKCRFSPVLYFNLNEPPGPKPKPQIKRFFSSSKFVNNFSASEVFAFSPPPKGRGDWFSDHPANTGCHSERKRRIRGRRPRFYLIIEAFSLGFFAFAQNDTHRNGQKNRTNRPSPEGEGALFRALFGFFVPGINE